MSKQHRNGGGNGSFMHKELMKIENMRNIGYIFSVLLVLIGFLNVVKGTATTVPAEVTSPFDSGYELKRTPEEINTALKKHKIIPDLLDKAPNDTIYVEWIPDGPSAKLGNEITAIRELECRPMWVNYKQFLTQMHTMIMIGLDEPSAQNRSSSLFLYWIVGNIPPHSYDNVPAMDHVAGETIVDYREPRPLPGTGLHRYVFLVYKHENKTINFTIPKLKHANVTERLHFNLNDFVKQYDLGEPYAVNYFVAQYQKPPYEPSTVDPNSDELTTLIVEHFSERSGGAVRMISKKVKKKDT